MRIHRLDLGKNRQFVRARQRYLCYSERKHSIASFHGEGQTEAVIQETPINLPVVAPLSLGGVFVDAAGKHWAIPDILWAPRFVSIFS
jgi:hypothetical protein